MAIAVDLRTAVVGPDRCGSTTIPGPPFPRQISPVSIFLRLQPTTASAFSIVLLPPPTLILLVLLGMTLHRSSFGRQVIVIGTNAEVARFSGLNVARVKTILFLLSALISALCGLLYAARLGSVRGDTAFGFELDIITMVLLGGVSIFGGPHASERVAQAVRQATGMVDGHLALPPFPFVSHLSPSPVPRTSP